MLLFLSPVFLYSLDTVDLTEDQGKYPLGLHFEYLEDKGGTLTIDDVTSPEYAGGFRRSGEEAPNFGYTRSPYWIRFKVRNTTRDSIKWLLKIDYYWFNTIELFSPLGDGSYSSKIAGYVVPIKEQDIKTNKHIFSFVVPRGGEETFYVRFRTTDLMILGMSIYSYDYLVKEDHEEQIINGLFYGAMIIMLLYNLFLFIFLSDRTYLYYILMVFFIILVQAASTPGKIGRAHV